MLKKSIILGTALVAGLFMFQPVEKAQARVNVDIGIGAPYYYYGPYYRRDYYYAPRRYYRRVSCRRARQIVRNRGFYRIRTIRCGGANYVFHAKKRGKWWRMNVRARTGSIYAVRRIR